MNAVLGMVVDGGEPGAPLRTTHLSNILHSLCSKCGRERAEDVDVPCRVVVGGEPCAPLRTTHLSNILSNDLSICSIANNNLLPSILHRPLSGLDPFGPHGPRRYITNATKPLDDSFLSLTVSPISSAAPLAIDSSVGSDFSTLPVVGGGVLSSCSLGIGANGLVPPDASGADGGTLSAPRSSLTSSNNILKWQGLNTFFH